MAKTEKAPAAPIRIEERWVDDAACRPDATRLPAYMWDAEVHHDYIAETPLQREVRLSIARHVCNAICPVHDECKDHAQRTRRKRLSPGMRGGKLFP